MALRALRNDKLDYHTLDEQTVVAVAQKGDLSAQGYLITKYKNVVRAKARSYFLVGADKEDVIQEGMIGLFKAIRDYRPDRLANFKSFAEICITKQMLTAIRMATRKKHAPLNGYVSLNYSYGDESNEWQLIDAVTAGDHQNPETIVISSEQVKHIKAKMEEVLSDFEQKVLAQHLEGKGYREIAKDLDRHAKSVDNALQRIKKKLERCLHDSPT